MFFSSLIWEKNGNEEILDARTSDAIALAVRFQAPIYTYDNILDKAGIYLKAEEEITFTEDEMEDEEQEVEMTFDEPSAVSEGDYGHLSLGELEERLGEAVDNEDYEIAARLRDEISKRS